MHEIIILYLSNNVKRIRIFADSVHSYVLLYYYNNMYNRKR